MIFPAWVSFSLENAWSSRALNRFRSAIFAVFRSLPGRNPHRSKPKKMFPWTPVKTEFLAALLKPRRSVRELQSTKIIHQHFHYIRVCFIYMNIFYVLGCMSCLPVIHHQGISGQAPGFECPSFCGLVAEVLSSYWSHCTESCKHFPPPTVRPWSRKM